MKRRRLIVTLLCAVSLTAFAIVYAQTSGHNSERPQRNNNEHPRHGALFRQQDIYEHMFRHYVFLKNAAARAEQEGKDGHELRSHYQREANLSAREADLLDTIASESVERISQIDNRAREIITAARERVPGGRLRRGETPPPPPVELSALQQERESVVMQARERLRSDFGDEAFARFDEFVQRSITGNMRPVELGEHRHRPNLRDGRNR